jgi:hypothetical protein
MSMTPVSLSMLDRAESKTTDEENREDYYSTEQRVVNTDA